MGLCFVTVCYSDTYISPYIYLDKVKQALDEYKNDCSRYPSQNEGLLKLVLSDEPCWNGPYIRIRSLLGYVGRPIKYKVDDETKLNSIELSTYGEDLLWNTADDILLSDDPKKRKFKFDKIIKKLQFRKQLKIALIPMFIFLILALILGFIFEWLIKLSATIKNRYK